MRFLKKTGELRDQYELVSEMVEFLSELIVNEEEE